MELIYISICVLVLGVSLYHLKFKKLIHNWIENRKAAQRRKEDFRRLVTLEKEKMLREVKFTTERAGHSADEIMRLTAKDWEEAQRYSPIFDRHRTEALRRTMYRRYYAHVDTVAEVRAEKILDDRQEAARLFAGGGSYGF